MRLKGKVAVITGAARGIGRAAAKLFADQGAHVVLVDVRDDLGVETEQAIRLAGGEATFVHADVGRAQDVRKVMATTGEIYGGLHVLYNNASVFAGQDDGPVTAIEEESESE